MKKRFLRLIHKLFPHYRKIIMGLKDNPYKPFVYAVTHNSICWFALKTPIHKDELMGKMIADIDCWPLFEVVFTEAEQVERLIMQLKKAQFTLKMADIAQELKNGGELVWEKLEETEQEIGTVIKYAVSVKQKAD